LLEGVHHPNLNTGVDAGTASGLIPFSQHTGRNPNLLLPPLHDFDPVLLITTQFLKSIT
jgi:hypothetical protein